MTDPVTGAGGIAPGGMQGPSGAGSARRAAEETGARISPAQRERLRLRRATEDFEALFMRELLRSMRRTIPEGGLTERGAERDMVDGMWDDQLATLLARGGRGGLAGLLYRSLEGRLPADEGAQNDLTEEGESIGEHETR
jgi:flagellar protein FlgJ